MKSKQNRSQRAEETTQTKDTTKVALDATPKKKKKKKLAPVAEKELTDANVAKGAKDEVEGRVTKYHYPADVKSNKEKKDFRRKARATIEQFEKKLKKLSKSTEEADQKELKKATKDYETWKHEFLNTQA